MKLPAHMSIALTCYVRSDDAGVGADIKVGGCVDTDFLTQGTVNLDGFRKSACEALNAAVEVTDARPMTAAEVKEYLAEKEGDERDAGRLSESASLKDIQDGSV